MAEHPRFSLSLAIVCADTTWCYVGLGVIGFFLGQAGSPLSWPVVLALLVTGNVVDRRLATLDREPANHSALRLGVAILGAYMAASTGSYADAGAVGPAWPVHALRGQYAIVTWLGLAAAMVASVFLWRHGARIRVDGMAFRRLLRSFRAGVIVFAVALGVEQASGRDLDAVPLLVPFFVATLTGLAISRLPTWRFRGGAWWQTVIATVAALVLLGVGLGLTVGAYGRGGIDYVLRAGGYLLDAMVWVVRTVSTFAIESVMTLLDWLGAWSDAEGAGLDDAATASQAWLESTLAQAAPWIDAAAHLLHVAVMLGIAYVAYRVFRMASQLIPEPSDFQLGEQHASIRGGADPASDLRRLLSSLLPQWVTRLASDDPDEPWRAVARRDDEAGRLYAELLTIAARHGHVFVESHTPLERAPDLAAVLPGAPVDAITEQFNESMYGRRSPDSGLLARLRDRLRECS